MSARLWASLYQWHLEYRHKHHAYCFPHTHDLWVSIASKKVCCLFALHFDSY